MIYVVQHTRDDGVGDVVGVAESVLREFLCN